MTGCFSLVFVRARLLPPGFSSALILHGGEGTVTVFTWCGLRARVVRALEEGQWCSSSG